MALYELMLLGDAFHEGRSLVIAGVESAVADFGLSLGGEVQVLGPDDVKARQRASAGAALYFHGANPDFDAQEAAIAMLLRDEVPIIPILAPDQSFESLPPILRGLNGMRFRQAEDAASITSALLECVGLLRRQRRVFISYRRTDSRNAAVQLHDLLIERGFDVFLDTHSVRPADPFQDVLWHRLVDADVLVMLDTPGYFDSKWTRREFGHALACNIHVLRVVWPDASPGGQLDYTEVERLNASDLNGQKRIKAARAKAIVDKVESLRSRSLGARYLNLVGKFRAEAEKVGARFEGVGANRALSIVLPGGERLWVYPVVGVPTAEVLNEIADNADRAMHEGKAIVLYEHIGIRPPYLRHLTWMELHPSALKAIKVREADWALVELS